MMLQESDLLDDVDVQYPCRNLQAKQLASFLSPASPALPAIVVHGQEATGKSSVLKLVLNHSRTRHAVIKSQECITGRHLLERTISGCIDALDENSDHKIERAQYTPCENLNALAARLQRLLLQAPEKFILVFDRIDRQREAPPTLLPALARLNEFIPNLTVVLVVTSPRQRFLHRAAVPYIHFPSYTRDETVQILSLSPLPILSDSDADEGAKWLWPRFCAAVYDSQGKAAARDVPSMRALAAHLWRPFIAPIAAGTHGPRDFSKLMVAQRRLFQSEEMLFAQKIAPPPAVYTPTPLSGGNMDLTPASGPPADAHGSTAAAAAASSANTTANLPFYAKYLLCACYLASHNPPRTDTTFFMHSHDKRKRRKRKQHQRHRSGEGASSAATSKRRTIPRRLLAPSAFPLERLLAIFHALLPYEVRLSVDVYTQLATLTALRLVVRSGAGAGAAGDVLDPSAGRWRVNVGWEYVVTLGRSVGLEVGEFVFEG